MVTWGVTDAGGSPASARSRAEDASDDAVTSLTDSRRPPVAEDSTPSSDCSERRHGGLPPITIEPTPAGLATALSHASAGLITTGPPRSHPAYRREPPPITVGERTRVPARVRAATPDVDATLELPPTMSALFVAAPLAYYLPASVRVRDAATPQLFVRGRPRVAFDDLETEAGRLLQWVFHLDCLVRDGPASVGRSRTDDAPDGLLATLELDPATVRSLSAERRLESYLSAWDSSHDDRLPDWHLSTSVEPTVDAVPCLPALLGRLSLIERPDGQPRERSALLDLTLSTAYRTRSSAESDESSAAGASPDVLASHAAAGRFHGWLAPGRPLEAFKATVTAFEHRRRYENRPPAPTSIAVVLGDDHVADEPERVAAAYRDGAGEDSLTVDVVRRPTRTALRETMRRGPDLLHYVGHCDDAGLRCSDGHLDAGAVSTCRVPAFFLNACGSYDAGLALVDRGAVAGAVTFADVLDRHATQVGTAFARLLTSGFSIQGALSLARRRILMGQDYAVVGDGTFAPWSDRRPPGVLYVDPIERGDGTDGGGGGHDDGGGGHDDEGEGHHHRTDSADAPRDETSDVGGPVVDADEADAFCVRYEHVTARAVGVRRSTPLGDGDVFAGDSVTTTLSRQSLRDHLAARSLPVVYGNDLLWSRDLDDRLGPDE